MRRHGWQLPYHPLQVVAVAVFLALGFAFYVFFVPFIGGKTFQYVVVGIYSPLVVCVFSLYIWCAATDPADPGVFKSKKYLEICSNKEHFNSKDTETAFGPYSSKNYINSSSEVDDEVSNNDKITDSKMVQKNMICHALSMCLAWSLGCPLALVRSFPCSDEYSSESQTSEDGMFYCSLCKVEVFKYSKHCRVCDKCVDGFDHHCRWLNNCVGRKNYQRFFTLMILSLVLLIVQWLTGILVLICCFIEPKRFTIEIIAKLGSIFSLAPFIVIVASCTLLAVLATLPLAQLLCFHILLIKKGISTYDYVVALREQDQLELGDHQSPQMSPLSSHTGFSSASSFNAFHHAAWCTPPRLFVDDKFDVVPTDVAMPSSSKRIPYDEPSKRKQNGSVKISPWTLARLNAPEVMRVAAEARNKSKILHPVKRPEVQTGLEADSSIGSGTDHLACRFDNWRHKKRRVGLSLGPLANLSSKATDHSLLCASSDRGSLAETSSSLAPLQLEARSAFHTSLAMSSAGIMASSPESSLDSPDLHPLRVLSAGAEDLDGIAVLAKADIRRGIKLLRSTSDGYEPSGEDSERILPRGSYSSSNWSSLLHGSGRVNSGAAELELHDDGKFSKS